MRNILLSVLALTSLHGLPILYGQHPNTALQQRLEKTYPITHATGDSTDILVPGVILVLKKDRLILTPINTPQKAGSSFKDGRIVPGLYAGLQNIPKRKFMTTEKVWVTDIEIKHDGVVFTFLSDVFDNVRYTGTLKFPFPKGEAKGEVPSYEEINSSIIEVFDTEFLPGAKQSQASTPPQAPVPIPVPAPAPIMPPPPPPPPPPTEPATTPQLLGKTTTEVTAAMGQPDKIVKLSAVKQIYIYKDVKVVFVSGKVTDIQ